MLTWETVKLVAERDGYRYVISQGDDDEPDEWGVEITNPDGGMDYNVCLTIEEAKEYCENTATAVQTERW